MIEYLLARALQRLPKQLRSRYEAEWRADLAVLGDRRWASLRWAIGLQHAASELRAQSGLKRPTRLPRLTCDALALGLAYYAAYLLRFDGDPPGRYHDLFVQTLPFAIVGGLACLALTGNYGTTNVGAFRLAKGITLTTLALIAYVALVQPTLVLTAQGLAVLNIPAGVTVLFALTATAATLINRALLQWTRARASTA
ncbi:hypothetical protein OJ998_22610 [Solirubrobacter taibaiensis]|nr:hypothetical protein [Solirubrobacter taibaiensis]